MLHYHNYTRTSNSQIPYFIKSKLDAFAAYRGFLQQHARLVCASTVYRDMPYLRDTAPMLTRQNSHSARTSGLGTRGFTAIRFFFMLLGGGWNTVTFTGRATAGSFYAVLSRHTLRLAANSGSATAHKRAHGSVTTSQYLFTLQFQWFNWSNFVALYANTCTYGLCTLVFSKIAHKTIVDYLNWSNTTVTTSLWRYTHKLFFLKYQLPSNTFALLQVLHHHYSVTLLLVVNAEYHITVLRQAALCNQPTAGLTNVYIEPWLFWYPIFCDGSNFTNQFLFLTGLLHYKHAAMLA